MIMDKPTKPFQRSWHPTKNLPTREQDYSAGTDHRFWWICAKDHESLSTPHDVLVRQYGCPYCTNRLACEENCLNTIYPAIAAQWHPHKNGTLTARDVVAGSNKRVWWICGEGHSWFTAIANRVQGKGCPYCTSRFVCADNSLQTLAPAIAAEWHPARNGELTPNNVTSNSSKAVWWRCAQGHDWRAVINNRTSFKQGCPVCHRLPDRDNSLLVIRPDLAKEWHPWLNNLLTPGDVSLFSNRYVWWKCRWGHRFRAKINNRTSRGNGCPKCRAKTKRRK
jgi:hypothetical protein